MRLVRLFALLFSFPIVQSLETRLRRDVENQLMAEVRPESPAKCNCTEEIYDENVPRGYLKSLFYPDPHCGSGICSYKILPAPGKAVFLEIESLDISLKSEIRMWQIFNFNGSERSTYRGIILGSDSSRYNHYMSGINAGFRIEFTADKNRFNSKGFKMAFDRGYPGDYDNTCGEPYVLVGLQPVVVQKHDIFRFPSGCVYEIIRKETLSKEAYQEIFIHIDEGEGENNYVDVRNRYNAEKLRIENIIATYEGPRNLTVDARSVQIASFFLPKRIGKHSSALITAKAIKKACLCGDDYIILNDTMSKAVIRSPGYPDLLCPNVHCSFTVDSHHHPSPDIKSVFLIETEIAILHEDTLHIDAGYKMIYTHSFNKDGTRASPSVMMIDATELEIVYQSTYEEWPRRFEVNITQLYIPQECQCSKYEEKDYDKAGSISITIPKQCSFIYCHWKVSEKTDLPAMHTRVEISMQNATYGDYVEIHSGAQQERYDAMLLKNPRIYGSTQPSFYIAFARLNVTAESDAVFNMSWNFGSVCECNNASFLTKLKSGEKVISETPGYPSFYCFNLNCEYHYLAPENHYLDVNIEVSETENFHDFLGIFDGKLSNSTLIGRLSGRLNNVTCRSSKEDLTMTFTSDGSVQYSGSRWTVRAVPLPQQETTGIMKTAKFFYFLIVTLLICVALVVYHRERIFPGYRLRSEARIRRSELESSQFSDTAPFGAEVQGNEEGSM